MSTLDERRKAVVRDHMEGENRLDFDAVIETFKRPRYELIGSGGVFDGKAEVRRYFELSRMPFPDQRNEPIALTAMENGVLAEFWLMGTHLGPLKTPAGDIPPTGKSFRVRMAALFLFDDGGDGIVCERVYFDQLSILAQLGLASEPAK